LLDPAPSDFYLFPFLRGAKFSNDSDVIASAVESVEDFLGERTTGLEYRSCRNNEITALK